MNGMSPKEYEHATRGPRPGELWSIGMYKHLHFLGIALDLREERFFVFEDMDDKKNLFIISKDEFFEPDLPRQRIIAE